MMMMKQKFLKKTPKENTPEIQTQKTPDNSQNIPLQEEPLNTTYVLKNTTYVLIPTQTSQTLIDIKNCKQTTSFSYPSSM